MAKEAFDVRDELAAALQPERDADFFPLNDLPNDLIVSVFAAAEDPTWVRHTFPLVCKDWAALYDSKDASPLHETLEIDFDKEEMAAAAAAASRAAARQAAAGARAVAAGSESEWEDEDEEEAAAADSESEWDDEDEREEEAPVVRASRVISWAQQRAGSVRKLRLEGGFRPGAFEDFSVEDLGISAGDLVRLIAVVGPSLTEISIGQHLTELCTRPFWESLGQLAGNLEELTVEDQVFEEDDEEDDRGQLRLPESFFGLKKLRSLKLNGLRQITALPAEISSLKKLEDLDLCYCRLSSLPKELGELSALTKLDLAGNRFLGATPEDEAFPAELAGMKSLRVLSLISCGLGTVPAFVGKLKSLESLDLRDNDLSSLPKELGDLSGLTELNISFNENLGRQEEAFPAELGKMKSLRELNLYNCGLRAVPAFIGELKSLERLDLFDNDDLQIDAPLDFLIEGCPRLREVKLKKGVFGGSFTPWTPASLAHLEAFKAKLRAKNPSAEVEY